MPMMFLLNPPKNGKSMPLVYPKHMGRASKPVVRPSKTFGGSRISAALRDAIGLKTGEHPVKHRITFYRHPKRTKKVLYRTPFAAFRNPKKKHRKGVLSIMAKRRIKHRRVRHNAKRVRRHARKARIIKVRINRRRRHVRSNPVARRVHRRSHRRSRIRAIVLANPRRHIRRHRRSRKNPFAIMNPFKGGKFAGAMKPVAKAASLFGGYFATKTVTNFLWEKVGDKLPENIRTAGWAKPAANVLVAVGLSYVTKRFIFKRKPEIANYILIGGIFAAIQELAATYVAPKIPWGPASEALQGEYSIEPVSGYEAEPVGADMGEEGVNNPYVPLY